jgi:hypothetical protein
MPPTRATGGVTMFRTSWLWRLFPFSLISAIAYGFCVITLWSRFHRGAFVSLNGWWCWVAFAAISLVLGLGFVPRRRIELGPDKLVQVGMFGRRRSLAVGEVFTIDRLPSDMGHGGLFMVYSFNVYDADRRRLARIGGYGFGKERMTAVHDGLAAAAGLFAG